jgi:hypothetical protein
MQIRIQNAGLFCIRIDNIGFNADTDPAFSVNVDPYPEFRV